MAIVYEMGVEYSRIVYGEVVRKWIVFFLQAEHYKNGTKWVRFLSKKSATHDQNNIGLHFGQLYTGATPTGGGGGR